MKITIINNNHEYSILQKIADALGYVIEIEPTVGPPFFPILYFKNQKLYIISGSDSKRIKEKEKEGYTELTALEFIHQLIINSKIQNL